MCRIPKVVKYFVYFSLFSMQWRSELLLRVWETIPCNRSIDHCLHHQKNHAIHQHADIIARNHSIYQFAFRFRFSIVDSRFFAVPFTNRWSILSFVVHTLGLVFFIFHYIFIYCLSRDFSFFLFCLIFFFYFLILILQLGYLFDSLDGLFYWFCYALSLGRGFGFYLYSLVEIKIV